MNFVSVSVSAPTDRVVFYKPSSKKKVSMTPSAAVSHIASATASPSASSKLIEHCMGVKEEIIAGHVVGFT